MVWRRGACHHAVFTCFRLTLLHLLLKSWVGHVVSTGTSAITRATQVNPNFSHTYTVRSHAHEQQSGSPVRPVFSDRERKPEEPGTGKTPQTPNETTLIDRSLIAEVKVWIQVPGFKKIEIARFDYVIPSELQMKRVLLSGTVSSAGLVELLAWLPKSPARLISTTSITKVSF